MSSVVLYFGVCVMFKIPVRIHMSILGPYSTYQDLQVLFQHCWLVVLATSFLFKDILTSWVQRYQELNQRSTSQRRSIVPPEDGLEGSTSSEVGASNRLWNSESVSWLHPVKNLWWCHIVVTAREWCLKWTSLILDLCSVSLGHVGSVPVSWTLGVAQLSG